MDNIKNSIIDILKKVYDPELPIDLWNLGLIYNLNVYKQPKEQYGVDINNSSTYLRNNISYSMITNNKLGSDSDDDYVSQILKNPYI